MLLNTTIKIMRAARTTLTTLIDLAEAFRDARASDPPPQAHVGLYSSVHGPVGPVRGFGSVYNQPDN